MDSTCRFTARTRGGYVGQGQWHLRLTRRGHTTIYSSGVSPSCGPVGTIQPGDDVEVTTSYGGGVSEETTGAGVTVEDSSIQAGHGYGC